MSKTNTFIIAVSYFLDHAKKIIAVEYYECISSCNAEQLDIPVSRQASFKEELRVFKHASSFYDSPRYDHKHIKEKIKEAYGNEVQINIEEIKQGTK